MKIANIIFLLLLFTFTFLSSIYGISPKLKSELLNNKIERLVTYSPNENYNNSINYLKTDINLNEVYVTSNGTHIEIKLLFDDLLANLKNILLNSSTVPHNFFVNIFIDSDDDETTGILGYNHRYFLSHNISDSYNETNNNLTSIVKKNLLQIPISNYSKEDEILENEEFAEVIARTINSQDMVEKLDWVIRGYEILGHDFQPLFFSSKVNEKYLSAIPDGFKITLDLEQIDYPSNYALLVEVGRKSDNYKLSTIFGKIHIPHPDLTVDDKIIDIEKGQNSVILEFNNTGLYDLNVKADLLNKSNSDDDDGLIINFSQGNQFSLLNGNGILPIGITTNSNYKQKNVVIPLKLSYNVIGENDFTTSNFNNSLTYENTYDKLVYLNFKLQERIPLIKVDEIPSQYIAVFLGAVFSFFIPSIAQQIKEHSQKRTANKYLKSILKEENSDNVDRSIKNMINSLKIIKHEFIRGKITKDQYEILKENIADVLKDLISKKTNNKNNNNKNNK